MKPLTLIADSVTEALAAVHRRLGPEAVIVNLRKTPAPGVSRIWKKDRIEVQAIIPPPAQKAHPTDSAAQFQNNVSELKRRLSNPDPAPHKPSSHVVARYRKSHSEQPASQPQPAVQNQSPAADGFHAAVEEQELLALLREEAGLMDSTASARSSSTAPQPDPKIDPQWKLTDLLENFGILPLHAQWLSDQVRTYSDGRQFESLREEFSAVQEFLHAYWQHLAAPAQRRTAGARILVGTPGIGKTTCICKWLTQEVLLENRPARVWRLDGHAVNTAEFLSIHGEILGIPVERVWDANSFSPDPRIHYIDLPGIQADDAGAISMLAHQLQDLNGAKIFLVLNAAYDLEHLLGHIRAFSKLPLSGLILSHVDEETRWSKFWNILVGARLPILYLSGGQNIPGQFSPATPENLCLADDGEE
jgi:flagellar biosynthesis GTPase FlhF